MIRTEALDIGYRKGQSTHLVQSSLSLSVEKGELVSLIGPNGCGKSTLLRSLCGLQEPLSGNVFVENLPLPSVSIQQRALLFALVLTDSVSIPYCTVSQLVATGRLPHTGRFGQLSDADHQRVESAMEQVSIQPLAHRRLSDLSDGERQRAMIARALAQDTPVIVLDEPTAHLDLPNRIEVSLLLKRLASDLSKTILISTHELELALRTSDQVWLMRPQSGGVVSGSPSELLANGQVQRVFQHPAYGFDEQGRVIVF